MENGGRRDEWEKSSFATITDADSGNRKRRYQYYLVQVPALFCIYQSLFVSTSVF